jgi:hypothetical protein
MRAVNALESEQAQLAVAAAGEAEAAARALLGLQAADGDMRCRTAS